ncbi:MAG: hypothetical protein ABI759_12415 [Candidatus Solibacter sp.]
MRLLVRLAVKLYPAAWRARYGRELEALMEDAGVSGGDVWDLAREAMVMQLTSVSFAKIVAGFTLAGVMAAGVWALSQTRHYESTAVMRLSPAEAVSGDPDVRARMSQRLMKLQEVALSRSSLAKIMMAQNLFQKERMEQPVEDVIEKMRNRSIRILMVDASRSPRGTLFMVKFSAAKPAEAQAATRAIVAALVEQNLAQEPAAGAGPANIEVLGPASLPTEPAAIDRAPIVRLAGLGLALGLAFGSLWWMTRRASMSLWRIGAFAVAGMAVGVAVAFLMPNEFVSTAVLRAADGPATQAAVRRVLSDESVAAMIRRQGLFQKEVGSEGMEAVTDKVRNEGIRVRTVQTAQGMTAYTVSFRYPDRFTAQRVTQDLVGQFTGQVANTEVLDRPSQPVSPSWPNRLQIGVLGSVLGVLLGTAASYFGRTRVVVA